MKVCQNRHLDEKQEKVRQNASEVSPVHDIRALWDLGVDGLFHIFPPQSLITFGRSEACKILTEAFDTPNPNNLTSLNLSL